MAEDLPLFLGLNDKTVTDIPKTVEKQRYVTSVAPKAANQGKWMSRRRARVSDFGSTIDPRQRWRKAGAK